MASTWKDWAPIPLRIMWGIGFMIHGAPKLFSGSEHAAFVGMLQGISIPAAGLTAWLVAIVEFFGGLALLVGAFVGLASVLLIVEMLVALFKVHLASGFAFVHIVGMTDTGPKFGLPGYEVNLLYIAGLLTLLLAGAGPLSVEAMRKRSPVGTVSSDPASRS